MVVFIFVLGFPSIVRNAESRVERPEPLMRNKDIGHELPRTEKAQQIQPA